MADTQHCVRDDVNVCQLCGELENLSVCGACKNAWYCSKSHQKLHWKKHKQVCQKIDHDVNDNNCVGKENKKIEIKECGESERTDLDSSFCLMKENSIDRESISSLSDKNENVSNKGNEEVDVTQGAHNVDVANNNQDSDLNLSTNFPQASKASSKKFKGAKRESVHNCGQQQRYYLDKTNTLSLPPAVDELSKDREMGRDTRNLSSVDSREQYLFILQSRFDEVSKYVVKCLTQYGICVVDKFLGEGTSEDIFKEVVELQSSGVMNQGQLVNGPSSSSKNRQIRGDIITWVDGTESHCENIHYLISCMDNVMLQGARSLEKCVINERTKGMVACYPGKGSGYVRHVDNPNGDGRCITCIYYLNKDWDVRKDGGLLRIYPEGSDQVANIEPVRDRLLFFWSDRRNPHEVENAMRERYAITVWYYDTEERAEALKRLKVHSSRDSKKRVSLSSEPPSGQKL